MNWDRELDRHVRMIAGPEDEADDEVNGDPDSTLGEEDERGFDGGPDEPDPLFVDDDGFDDAEGADEEDDEDTDIEDDEE
jgi:hypothetical protein